MAPAKAARKDLQTEEVKKIPPTHEREGTKRRPGGPGTRTQSPGRVRTLTHGKVRDGMAKAPVAPRLPQAQQRATSPARGVAGLHPARHEEVENPQDADWTLKLERPTCPRRVWTNSKAECKRWKATSMPFRETCVRPEQTRTLKAREGLHAISQPMRSAQT